MPDGLAISPDLSLPLRAVTETLALVGALSGPLMVGAVSYDTHDLVSVVDRLGNRTDFGECWLWLGYTKNGYPCISLRNRPVYGHRLILAIREGGDIGSRDACHTCDVRACWRPVHLFAGTRSENIQDAYAKGRAVPPPRISGADHYRATLSEAQLYAISSAPGTQRSVAECFGVSQSTVWRARHGLARADDRGVCADLITPGPVIDR